MHLLTRRPQHLFEAGSDMGLGFRVSVKYDVPIHSRSQNTITGRDFCKSWKPSCGIAQYREAVPQNGVTF